MLFSIWIKYFLILFSFTHDSFSIKQIEGFDVRAPYALLLDLQTNQALFEKNAHEKMTPSSMTKVLTSYILFQAIKNKSLSLKDKISVSKHAAKQKGSRMFLIPNKAIPAEDLLKGIIVVSGNDACTAMSEHIAGSESAFAERMNAVAKSLGAEHSHFMNASGLPHENHYSTCWDLAHISAKLIKTFPAMYKKYYSIPFFSFNNIQQMNKNPLLKSGADGIKTGQTAKGKFGMVASEERNGRRLIVVINGCKNALEREQEGRRLLDMGFTQYHNLIIKKNQFITDIQVWKRTPIRAVTGQSFSLSIPDKDQKVQVKALYKKPLFHPIKKGQQVGSLLITIPEGTDVRIPLVAENATQPGGIKRLIKKIFNILH